MIVFMGILTPILIFVDVKLIGAWVNPPSLCRYTAHSLIPNVQHFGRNYQSKRTVGSSVSTPILSSSFSDDDDDDDKNPHDDKKQYSDTSDSQRRRKIIFSLLSSAASIHIPISKSQEVLAETTTTTTASRQNNYPSFSIIIPPLDTRSYDTYILPNGLRVLLCSDPSSNIAAAAMNVHVGSSSDPIEIPGMAHFAEHMLFLGTKSYPEEGSFESFLSSNGGSSNAFTEGENTVYYFDMNAESEPKLAEGLDRFGSFFSSPLFTESATNRELNAIESENAKNLQSDAFRLYQIEKSRATRRHPYSKFYTGNKATLLEGTLKQNLDLRSELIKFWSTYYNADQMSLAIVAPQSIQNLNRMVMSSFQNIRNNSNRPFIRPEDQWNGLVLPFTGHLAVSNRTINSYDLRTQQAVNQKQQDLSNLGSGQAEGSIIPSQGYIVEVVPVADARQVQLVWPVIYKSAMDRMNQDLIKPAVFVSQLLGYEGRNSLLSYLKRQGWANALGASTDGDFSDFYTFGVTVGLTSQGLAQVDQVIETIFSYIAMMNEGKSVPQYIFNEVLQISELNWRFLTKGEAGSYAQSLVKGMNDYPPQYYVAGPRRVVLNGVNSNNPRTQFQTDDQYASTVEAVSSLISALTVDNALITLISKSFDGPNNKLEFWYGTKYNVKVISSSSRQRWISPKSAASLDMKFPRPNAFIPSEEGLRVKIPVSLNAANRNLSFEERIKPISPPSLIRDDERWSVYFKQDDRFGLPKGYIIFQLLTQDAYYGREKAALSQLYLLSTADCLTEYTYDANLADLSYDLQVLPRGVRLTFGGYNDKLLDFASYVCNKLSKDISTLLPKNDAEFERYKDTISRALSAFDVQQPYGHASFYSSLCFQPPNFVYSNSDLRLALEKLSLNDLRAYANNVWKSGKGEALIQGNFDSKEAMNFINMIDKVLDFKSVRTDELPPRLHALPLPTVPMNGTPVKLKVLEPNPSNINAVSHVSIQALGKSDLDHVLIEILAAILNEPFYDDLRTKQQLGYIVSNGVKAVSETRNLAFVVQSSIVKAETLTERIFEFLEQVKSRFLNPLSDANLALYVKGLILKRTEPDKKLASEATRNWNEIATGRMTFDRMQREVQVLLDVTKSDVVKYWEDIYIGIEEGKRILVTEITPRSGNAASPQPMRKTGYSYLANGNNNPIILGLDDIDSFRLRPPDVA